MSLNDSIMQWLSGVATDPDVADQFIDAILSDQDLLDRLANPENTDNDDNVLTNEELLDLILNGDIVIPTNLNTNNTGPQIAPESIEPTFEDLFQETLQEQLGPDPFATFQNIFSDILTGVANTPMENYVLSQFDAQRSAYIAAARAQAEAGEPIPTFEEYLTFVRPSLEERFQFTDDAKVEALDQILNLTGNVETPRNRFFIRNFDRIFRDFVRQADERERSGGEPPDFAQFFGEIAPNLEEEFQFTREGAFENFQDVQRLREGARIAQSPFERFIERDFDRIFGEFQRSDPDAVGTFGEFLGENEDRFRTEFNLMSPFEQGRIPEGSRNDKRPARIQAS